MREIERQAEAERSAGDAGARDATEAHQGAAPYNDDDNDDLFDLFPAPPPAMRGVSLPPVVEAPPNPNVAPGAPAADSPSAEPHSASEPTTWRSTSKPPIPHVPPVIAQSDTLRPGPLPVTPAPPAAHPDEEDEAHADVAPRLAMPPPALAASAEEITNQIHELEARLEGLVRQSRESRGGSSKSGARAPERVRRDPARPAAEEPEGVQARELFSTDFYLRQWGRIGMRNRSEEVDEFGLDPKYEARYKPFFDFLYKHYFRVDAQGTDAIPGEGRCIIVSNHSGGALPYDGIMLRTTLRIEHPSRRELRWLAEDFIYHLPFVGAVMNRLGAVRACQENAERLLDQDRLVAVFPEGAKGIGKLYRERYRLQRFGRGGFIRLCLRTRTPLVPCAIIGAEEANPMLYRVEHLTKALGVPYLPVTPTFPALGPLGLLPAPTKWKIRFGEPIRFDEYGPDDADDDVLVGRLAERVRTTIQGLLDKALAERKSIWFG